jgi:hypothetical protein
MAGSEKKKKRIKERRGILETQVRQTPGMVTAHKPI